MMNEKTTLIDLLGQIFGGAGTTIIGAATGRLMWHANEARKLRRRFFGPELAWELPIAIGMAIIGEAVAAWLGFDQPIRTGVVAALAYLGPRGAEVLFMKWFGRGDRS